MMKEMDSLRAPVACNREHEKVGTHNPSTGPVVRSQDTSRGRGAGTGERTRAARIRGCGNPRFADFRFELNPINPHMCAQ